MNASRWSGSSSVRRWSLSRGGEVAIRRAWAKESRLRLRARAAGGGGLGEFDGPPDGSEDHHRDPQQRCARPSTRFPAVQCGGRRRAVPGSRRAGASATESFCGIVPWTRRSCCSGTPRETARHDGSGSDTPGCCPVAPPGASSSGRQPLPLVFIGPHGLAATEPQCTDARSGATAAFGAATAAQS